LAKAELITSNFLREQRKLAIVVVFLLAAILTQPDVFSQILLAIPLLLLYEVSISIARNVERKRLKQILE
jgi:sec-independent protein translocase protein TatC